MTDPKLQNQPATECESSNLQLSAIVEESNDAIIGESLDGIILSWNGGAEKMFGYPAEEVIGKSVTMLLPQEKQGEVQELLGKVKNGEIIADYDSVRVCKDGSIINVSLSVSPVHKDGTIIGASVVEHNITKRKQQEALSQRMSLLYAALSKCNEAIVRCTNETELFKEVCMAAVQFGGMTMAWVGLVDEASKQVKPVALYGKGAEYLEGIQISVNADDPNGRGPTGTSIRENRPVWCQDFQNDPMTAPWHERGKKVSWKASASLPLLRNSIPIGSLTLYSEHISAFDDEAQRLLIEMTTDINFALDSLTHAAELKKSEEALLQIQTVVENSQDAIFAASLEGVILSWNGGAQKIFGYTPGEIIGKSSIILFSPEKKEELPIFISKIKQKESILNYETVGLRKDGSKIDLSLSISSILKEDGSVTSVSVVIRNIAERKQAENELRASEHKYSTLVEKGNDGILIIDNEGKLVYLNSIICGMTGYTKEESISTPFLNYVAPEYKELVTERYAKRIKGQETPNKYDIELISKAGTKTPIEVNASQIEYEGKPAVMAIVRDITERKKADAALHESMREASEAQRIAHIGNWTWDIATDKIVWSQEYYKIIGTDPSQPPPNYEDHLKAYTPESAAKLDAAVKKEMETGEPYELDLEFAHPIEGAAKWITARSETIRDKEGKIIGLRGTAQNITAKTIGIEKLRRTTRALKTLSAVNQELVRVEDEQEILNKICTIVVEDGGYQFAWIGYKETDEAKTIRVGAEVGFEKGYLESLKFSWAEDERNRRPMSVAIRTGQINIVNDVAENKDHIFPQEEVEKYGYKSVVAVPLRIDDTVIGAIAISATEPNAFDEDEMKMLQELANDLSFGIKSVRLKEERRRLDAAMSKLKKAVDASGEAIYMTNPDGMITFINPEFTNLYGYTAGEVVGKTTPRILKSGLISPAQYEAFWKKLLSKQKLKDEHVNKTKDGRLITVESSTNPIIDENGEIAGFLAIQHDITERKQAEEHIKELNEVRNKFIEIISHQLRTPLGAINWNLEMLLRGEFGKLDITQEKFLQVTYDASIRTTSRIHDLLTAMDVEEGRVVFEKEDVAIDSICAGVLNGKINECKLKHISCHYTPPEGDTTIKGDSEKIRSVITKLTDNAVAYTKEGGKISAKLSRTDNTVRFEINDNGVGIPEHEQQRIFSRFFRGSNASVMQTDAFGLGLYLSKHFIEQMGGKIGFQSKEGVGSTFWFEIPVK